MNYQTFSGNLGNEVIETSIPDSYMEEAQKWHLQMIESLAETNETLLDLYYNNEDISEAIIKETCKEKCN